MPSSSPAPSTTAVTPSRLPVISAMGNLPVVKDLVVDMAPFWQKVRTIKPFLDTHGEDPGAGEWRVTPEQGALVEPLAVGVHGVRWARMQPGARVVILGAGTIGLTTLMAARALGASAVHITARHAHQAALAREFGATTVLSDDPAAVIHNGDGLCYYDLQKELVAVISKYVSINPDDIKVDSFFVVTIMAKKKKKSKKSKKSIYSKKMRELDGHNHGCVDKT